jgi:hypothetical protein
VASPTKRRPPGNPPQKGGAPSGRPLTKEQRRIQLAARSVSVASRPPWQSPAVITSVSVGVVAIVLIIIVVINQLGGGSATGATPLSSTVASILLHPSTSVIQAVGSGSQPGQMVRLPGDTTLKDTDGKMTVVYVGAEYCPYCAAERWVIVYALSQFGTFTGLSQIESSSTDSFANTNTLTFYKSSYSSSIIDFSAAELQDRNRNQLQTATAQVENIFTTYDRPPYTVETQQYPFLFVGGRYLLKNTSYSPTLLAGLTWDQIATKLKNPADPVTQAIVGNANILTAAMCIATGDTPTSVCSSSTILAIEPALRTMQVTSG